MNRLSLRSILVLFAGIAATMRLMFAYIDPNTGGMLFQLLAMTFAFFSGILLFFSRHIKTSFARFKRLFRRDR